MLSIYIGFDKEAIRDVSTYFENIYEDDWFSDDFVKYIVKTIDGSEVVSSRSIFNPIFGNMSCEEISSTSKTLILLYKDSDFYGDLITCGENAEDLIIEISNRVDRTISFSGYDLSFYGKEVNFLCKNDGSRMVSYKDWSKKLIEYGV